MHESRLPTALWVAAHLRRCASAGAFATVLRRGDPDRGVVVQKLRCFSGLCEARTQSLDAQGHVVWIAALGGAARAEAEVDAWIGRMVARDDDLWVIEIESAEGWSPFEGDLI